MIGDDAGALSGFQDAFAGALFAEGNGLAEEMAAIAGQPGFAIYRNGVMKHAIDALQANYPAVARVVGEEWFRAAAAIFVRTSPPRTPMLIEYGADFPGFLGRFAPAAAIAYVADVARLDRMWTESHLGPDDAQLDPARIVSLSPEALGRTILRPHACARWAWFDTAPVYSIWAASRGNATSLASIDWHAEGALLTRPGDSVEWMPLDAGACAFLDRCAGGVNLALAAQAALAANAATDLSQLMHTLFAAGALATMDQDADIGRET